MWRSSRLQLWHRETEFIASRVYPPSNLMLLRLICVDAVASETEFVVRQFPVSIGRGIEADVTINDSWASRRHCEISCDGDSLTVRDLDSRNGTRVNGEVIRESPLLPGDELTVGISTFLISAPSSDSSVTRQNPEKCRELVSA